ncbi:MAG: hypothetical protein AAGA18_13850 [Verrucomicrobiota bacterium]
MGFRFRGLLLEYGSGLIGPIPNIVIFQFNPESLSRTINVPERPTGANSRETGQAGDMPVETLSLTAHFHAADLLKDNKILARGFGIGPQLAALEKMVQPSNIIAGLIGEAIDAIGDAISGGDEDVPAQPIPREKYPKIIFMWGPTRVLPVTIQSMTINEQQYDFLLNPTQAEVSITMAVQDVDPCSDDWLAKGAKTYTDIVKEAMAIANLANTVEQAIEMVVDV